MQNELNKPLASYKGVCYDKLKGRWKARALVNGKRISVGYHDTVEQAIKAVQAVQVPVTEQAVQGEITVQTSEGPVTAIVPQGYLTKRELRKQTAEQANKDQFTPIIYRVRHTERERRLVPPPSNGFVWHAQEIPVSPEELPVPDNYQDIVARAQRTTTVVQHNKLIETPNTSTLLEARIFCFMLRTIRKGDTEAPTAVIPIEELFSTFGGHQHMLLEAAMRRMMTATMSIRESNEENVHLVSLCDSMRYDSDTNMLIATFGKAVTPYLINLAGNFALADVGELLAIKSNSTHKLYWLMRAWQFKSPHTVSVKELKALTIGGDHYNEYSDFRRKVLKPSVAELNELSFDITYTERKQQRGRSVENITFNINRKNKEEQLVLPLDAAEFEVVKKLLSPLQQKVQTRLQKLKLTEVQIQKVLQVIVTEPELTKLLKETYPTLRDFETKAKPGENVAAATMALLKSTFPQIWRAK